MASIERVPEELERGSADAPVRVPADAPPAHANREERFPLFDSLRAIAALGVFVIHTRFLAEYGALEPFVYRLDAGVTLFFVISGFLLYRPFAAAHIDAAHAVATGPYAWRRLLRIAPAAWVTAIVVAVWLGVEEVFSADGAAVLSLTTVYREDEVGTLPGLGPYWTLGVELGFYVFLPLWAMAIGRLPALTRRGRIRKELWALLALAVASMAIKLLFVWEDDVGGATRAFTGVPRYLDQFAVGMALAVLSVALDGRRLPAPLRVVDRRPGVPWAVAAVAFVVAAFAVELPHDFDPGRIAPSSSFGGHVLYAVVAVGLILPAVFGDQRRGRVRRLLRNRVLLWIGVVSYGLYLWHTAVIEQLDRWDWDLERSGAISVAVALAASLALAAGSYALVERPALGLRRRRPLRELRTAPVSWRVAAAAGVGALVLGVAGLVLTPPGVGDTPSVGNPTKAAHLVVTYDGWTAKLYVDGEELADAALRGPLDAGSGAVEIGSFMGAANWTGVIDEVAFYGRPLRAAEVLDHHRNGRVRAAGEQGLYGLGVTLTPGLLAHLRLGASDQRAREEAQRLRLVDTRAAPRPARGLLVGDRDSAARFAGGKDGMQVQAAAIGDLTRAFTVEAWARPAADVDEPHAVVLSRPGSWVLQRDMLERWSIDLAAGGRHVAATAAAGSEELARRPMALEPPKPTPDPFLLLALGGIAVLVATLATKPRKTSPV